MVVLAVGFVRGSAATHSLVIKLMAVEPWPARGLLRNARVPSCQIGLGKPMLFILRRENAGTGKVCVRVCTSLGVCHTGLCTALGGGARAAVEPLLCASTCVHSGIQPTGVIRPLCTKKFP